MQVKSDIIYNEIKNFFDYTKIKNYLDAHQKNFLDLSRQQPDISKYIKQKFSISCSDANQIYEILNQNNFSKNQAEMLKHILNLKHAILNGDDTLQICQLLKILKKENSQEVNSEILYCLGYLIQRQKRDLSSTDSEYKEISAIVENFNSDVSEKALHFIQGLILSQQDKDSFIDYQKQKLKINKIDNKFQPQKCQQMVQTCQSVFNQECIQIMDTNLNDMIKGLSKKTLKSVTQFNQPVITEENGSDRCWYESTYTCVKKIYDKIQEGKIIKKNDIDQYLPSNFLSLFDFSVIPLLSRYRSLKYCFINMMIAEIFSLATKQQFQPCVIEKLSYCISTQFQIQNREMQLSCNSFDFDSLPSVNEFQNSRLDQSCKALQHQIQKNKSLLKDDLLLRINQCVYSQNFQVKKVAMQILQQNNQNEKVNHKQLIMVSISYLKQMQDLDQEKKNFYLDLIFENSQFGDKNINGTFELEQLMDISNLLLKQQYSLEEILKLAQALNNILSTQQILIKFDINSKSTFLANIQQSMQINLEKQDIVKEFIGIIMKLHCIGLPQQTISYLFEICNKLQVDQQVLLLLIIKDYSDKKEFSQKELETISIKINDCRVYQYDEEDKSIKIDKKKRHQNRRSISQIVGEIYEKQLEKNIMLNKNTVKQIFCGIKEQEKQNPIARILFARCLHLFTYKGGILENEIMDQILEKLKKDLHDVAIYSQMSFIQSIYNQIHSKQNNLYSFQVSQLKQIFQQQEFKILERDEDLTNYRNLYTLHIIYISFENEYIEDIIEILLIIVEQQQEKVESINAMHKIQQMTNNFFRNDALLILKNVITFKQKVSENVLLIFLNKFYEQNISDQEIIDTFCLLDKYAEVYEVTQEIFEKIEIQRASLHMINQQHQIQDQCSYLLKKAHQGIEIPPYVFLIFQKYLDNESVLKCILQVLKNQQNLQQSIIEKLGEMLNPVRPQQLILEICRYYCKNNNYLPDSVIQKSQQILEFSDSALNLFCEMTQLQIILRDEIIEQMCLKFKSIQNDPKYQYSLLSALVSQIPKKQDLQVSEQQIRLKNQSEIPILQNIKQVLALSIQQDNQNIIQEALIGIEKLLQNNPDIIDEQIINNLIMNVCDQMNQQKIIQILSKLKINEQQNEKIQIFLGQQQEKSDIEFKKLTSFKKLLNQYEHYGKIPENNFLEVELITHEKFKGFQKNLDEKGQENEEKFLRQQNDKDLVQSHYKEEDTYSQEETCEYYNYHYEEEQDGDNYEDEKDEDDDEDEEVENEDEDIEDDDEEDDDDEYYSDYQVESIDKDKEQNQEEKKMQKKLIENLNFLFKEKLKIKNSIFEGRWKQVQGKILSIKNEISLLKLITIHFEQDLEFYEAVIQIAFYMSKVDFKESKYILKNFKCNETMINQFKLKAIETLIEEKLPHLEIGSGYFQHLKVYITENYEFDKIEFIFNSLNDLENTSQLDFLLDMLKGHQKNITEIKYFSSKCSIKELTYLLHSKCLIDKIKQQQQNRYFRDILINLLKQQWTFEQLEKIINFGQNCQNGFDNIFIILEIIYQYKISPNFYDDLLIILQNHTEEWVEKVNKVAISKNFQYQRKKNLEEIIKEFTEVLNIDQQFENNLSQQVQQIKTLFAAKNQSFNFQSWLNNIKRNGNQYDLNDALAVIMHANHLCTNFVFTDSQILACLILHKYKNQNGNSGIILQVFTGEGKSTIVSAIAILEALKGIKVDIVTSNMVLAERDSRQKQKLYNYFDLSCDHNGQLEDYYEGEKNCYLSDIVYGEASQFQFDTLNDQYHQNQTLAGRLKYKRVVIIDEVDSMLIDDSSRISKLTSIIPLMDCFQLVYLKIWKRVISIQKEIPQFNDELENSDDFIQFKQEDIQEGNIKNLQNTIRDEIVWFVNENMIKVPNNLKDYYDNQLEKWIENAFRALHMKKNIDYIVKDNKIMPVEFDTTGVVLNNTCWNDGLHQFLQIKEDVHLQQESLTTNFLSNVSYFKEYSYIYGLTGTLGSDKSKEVLKSVYNTKLAIIPSQNYKQFINLGTQILPNRKEWINRICLRVKSEGKKCRGTLVICESINDVHEISQNLKRILGTNQIKQYTENNDNQEHRIETINQKEVIVATNLAGRGTDINTQDIENYGGLHVLITFLPNNQRVEEQAMGRTSRQGKYWPSNVSLIFHDLDSVQCEQLIPMLRNQNILFQLIVQTNDVYDFQNYITNAKRNSQKILLNDTKSLENILKQFQNDQKDLLKEFKQVFNENGYQFVPEFCEDKPFPWYSFTLVLCAAIIQLCIGTVLLFTPGFQKWGFSIIFEGLLDLYTLYKIQRDKEFGWQQYLKQKGIAYAIIAVTVGVKKIKAKYQMKQSAKGVQTTEQLCVQQAETLIESTSITQTAQQLNGQALQKLDIILKFKQVFTEALPLIIANLFNDQFFKFLEEKLAIKIQDSLK
ncbi:hypothetical protein ABPG74_001977, partial [Tetrahymena malaccensis]